MEKRIVSTSVNVKSMYILKLHIKNKEQGVNITCISENAVLVFIAMVMPVTFVGFHSFIETKNKTFKLMAVTKTYCIDKL